MYDETFVSKRVAALREAKGISAREMSLSMGQSQSYINKIENGMTSPSLEMLYYICDFLGITIKQFFDEMNSKSYPNQVLINEITTELQTMNVEALTALKTIVIEMNRTQTPDRV